ncbi:beta-glucosidase [Microbispora rosea subsp. aerata]|nr:GH1 family beta-glucosidase [Microbispora rosea]GGO04513.1 beta-glucosidase [Microbispora rosea subsp. aerata]GIH56330.1 beta-glucosidase [Microbispora rosea subsp. aerata]GLJ82229.1 beta-glucosidase [Microbispora rosea subsp. aerata]
MFLWGTATASYQIEGAATEDGRGPSIWDTFSHTPGKVRDGHTGDVACDHYHRYREDVALMAGLGVNAYRFSIAWPRVMPAGHGPVNQAGLGFYDRLVDALCERGITPVPTFFHWDLPQALEDRGGWLDRDTSRRFADYAAVVAERLADRVRMWITLNEPFVHMVEGYGRGLHAPGRTLKFGALPVAHHQLLGHGLAAQALRAAGAGQVLITNNCTPVWPASDSPEDLAAAEIYDVLHNRLFNDPVLTGAYPDLTAFGVEMPVRPGDLEVIAQPLDGLGINYYQPTRIGGPGDDGLPFRFEEITGVPVTAFGWPVVPDGLRELLDGLKARYGDALPPVYVTENGCSYDGLDDRERIAYLEGHITAMRRAEVDLRGYFVWSLLDNFEWAEGYHQRFGLVHVDFETQRRTPKASYHWLRKFLADQSTDT